MGKEEIVKRLMELRKEMDKEGGGPDDWYFALFDVTQVLELNDGQATAVIGPKIWTMGVFTLLPMGEYDG